MLKKMIYSLLALAMAIGVMGSSAGTAEARRGGLVAGALVGGLVAGAVIAGSARGAYADERCYKGPRRCERGPDRCYYNRFGDYVCRGGEYRCWRPTICD